MLPEILQDVDERIPDLSRGGEPAGVVPIRPDPATAPERAVHGSCEPDGEALEATGERVAVDGLHEHVHMVRLHGELDHPEVPAGRSCQRAAEHLEGCRLAE